MASTDNEVAAALVEVIGSGAVPREQLHKRLKEAGHRIGADDVNRHLQFDMAFVELEDGVVHIPTLTEGVAFSLWVDAESAEEERLVMYPALDAIGWWIVEHGTDLFDEAGERIGAVRTDGWYIDDVDTDVLLGPVGWLDEVANSWIALRVKHDTLVMERLTAPSPVGPERAAAVRVAFYAVAEHQTYQPLDADEPVDVMRAQPSAVMQEAIFRDRQLFAGEPLPPAVDLFAASGLRLEKRVAVPDDLDAEILAAANVERRQMARWGVDGEAVLGAQMLLGAMRLHADGDPTAFGVDDEERAAAPALLAVVLEQKPVDAIMGFEIAEPEAAERALGFADELVDIFDADDRIWGPSWLAAHCHLVMGNVDAAAEILDRVPTVDDCLPLLVDRALIAADRSQAKEALRLVSAAGRLADDLSDIALLSFGYRRVLGGLHDEIGIWASNPPAATARRNDRCPCGSGRKYKVCHLGREFHPIEDRSAWLYQKMTRFARAAVPDEIDSLASTMADAMDSHDRWDSLADTPLIPDIVLHEQRLAQRFLDGRLATLPDDEAVLAQQWLLVDRSVFEVESVGSQRLSLRDLATGEAVEISNVGEPPSSAPGSLLLGRPLPVGDEYRAFSGFMAVRPDLVSEALTLLDGGDANELVEFLGAMHRPPATQNADGQELVLPELDDRVDDTRPASSIDHAEFMRDPALQAALEVHYVNYEKEWLETPVPALGDQTPREAAADPITREDLIRLLATFPEPEDGLAGMSPKRLRAALGL